MLETGVIISVQGDRAIVKIPNTERCSACQCCTFDRERNSSFEVINSVNAHIGDKVEFEITPQKVIFNSSLVFLLPVIMLILGYTLASSFNSPESIKIMISFGGVIISFGIIKIIDAFIYRKKCPDFRIIRLIEAQALN
jgi:positive regulator of sigma E activity